MTPKFAAYAATAAFDASQSSSTFTKSDIFQSFSVTPAGHRGRDVQASVDTHEIVVHEVHRRHVIVVLRFL